MKRMFFCLFFITFVFSVFSEKRSKDFVFLTILEISNQRILTDAQRFNMPIFFDKWNNVYLPNGNSHVVSIFSSDFKTFGIFKSNDDEAVFDSDGMFRTLWDSLVDAHNYAATRFSINEGKLLDVMRRYPLGFDIAIDDLLLFFDDEINRPRGFLILDEKTRQVKPLSPEELVEYVQDNGERYDLSLVGDAILYKGWTWERSGSNKVWGNGNYASWLAIDKDKLAYSYPEVYAPGGEGC